MSTSRRRHSSRHAVWGSDFSAGGWLQTLHSPGRPAGPRADRRQAGSLRGDVGGDHARLCSSPPAVREPILAAGMRLRSTDHSRPAVRSGGPMGPPARASTEPRIRHAEAARYSVDACRSRDDLGGGTTTCGGPDLPDPAPGHRLAKPHIQRKRFMRPVADGGVATLGTVIGPVWEKKKKKKNLFPKIVGGGGGGGGEGNFFGGL